MRRLLDRAVAASSNGIVITDPKLPDNPIVYVNPAFEKISGYAAEEVRGRNCRFLQAEDRDQSSLDELRVALREERECRVVLRNYRKDGTSFWNELYVSPVHDEEGRLTNFVGVQNDITERRRIEELLRESEAKNVSGPPSNTPPSVLRRSVSTAAGCA
jgi:PAS domain S-box-containing protein